MFEKPHRRGLSDTSIDKRPLIVPPVINGPAPSAPPVIEPPPQPIALAAQGGPGTEATVLTPSAAQVPGLLETSDGTWHIGNWVINKKDQEVTIGTGSVPSEAEKAPGGKMITIQGPESVLHVMIATEPRRAPTPVAEPEVPPPTEPAPPPPEPPIGEEAAAGIKEAS